MAVGFVCLFFEFLNTDSHFMLKKKNRNMNGALMEEAYDLIRREAKARGLGVCCQSVYLERPCITNPGRGVGGKEI